MSSAATRRRNLRSLKLDPKSLMERAGRGRYTYWRDLLNDDSKSFGEKAARTIEADLGLPPNWLDTDWTSEQHSGQGVILHPVAQKLSLSPFHDVPTITLGANMDWDNLPPAFEAAMPDDALAPDYPRGLVFIWSTAKPPVAGSVVLLRDSHGQPQVREYRPSIEPGRWTGAATNRAYPSLDEQAARLVAVAKFRGMP